EVAPCDLALMALFMGLIIGDSGPGKQEDSMSEAVAEKNWITGIRQHPERAIPQRAQEFLAQGYVAHVGFEQDGRPYVIPMLYQYDSGEPDRVYVHGGLSSRTIRHLASGVPVCVTVTEL